MRENNLQKNLKVWDTDKSKQAPASSGAHMLFVSSQNLA